MKKTRLLEIIREEIAGALNEAGLGDQISMLQKQKDAVEKQKAPLTKKEADISKKIADLEKKQADAEIKAGAQLEENTSPEYMKGYGDGYTDGYYDGKSGNEKAVELNEALEEEQLNEDILMETPFIGGSLDFAYIDGKIEKGILGKALTKATQEIQNTFPETDPDTATKIVTSKKSRTSEKTPESIKTALEQIDDTLEAQADTFEDINLLKKIKDSKDFSTEEQVAIENYIEKATVPDEKTGKVKQYTYNLGFPQTLRAVEKILSGGKPSNVEPVIVSKSIDEPFKKEKSKKATLTKGDDGFDDVTYSKSEPKKEEPKKEKESSEEKAIKFAKSSSKLDKISDDKDKLLKALKNAKEERLAVAEKRKNAKSEAEKEKLFDELKRINRLESELQNRINKFKF